MEIEITRARKKQFSFFDSEIQVEDGKVVNKLAIETDYYFEKVREGVVIRGGGACVTFWPRGKVLICIGKGRSKMRLCIRCSLEHCVTSKFA